MKIRFLAAALCVAGTAAFAAPALADSHAMTSDSIKIAEFSCRDLLGLPDQEREFGLMYYTGYMDGKAGATDLNDTEKGELTDKVLGLCLDDPSTALLTAFENAAK